jgi:hypothetical protein
MPLKGMCRFCFCIIRTIRHSPSSPSPLQTASPTIARADERLFALPLTFSATKNIPEAADAVADGDAVKRARGSKAGERVGGGGRSPGLARIAEER